MKRGKEAPMEFERVFKPKNETWITAFNEYSNIKKSIEKVSLSGPVESPLTQSLTVRDTLKVRDSPMDAPRDTLQVKNTKNSQIHDTLKPTIEKLRHALHLVYYSLSIFVLLYFALFIVWTVQHDLSLKKEQAQQEILIQITSCSKLYQENRCHPTSRVPALEKQCLEWEICMTRDPVKVQKMVIGAEAIAEILNKLIEPLSLKTMV